MGEDFKLADAGAHILPDTSQMRAVATGCDLGGRSSEAVTWDGDGEAGGTELASLREEAEGGRAAAAALPVPRLPTAMQISPEESQISELMTVELPVGCFAARVGCA
jgi:hypothetical protein